MGCRYVRRSVRAKNHEMSSYAREHALLEVAVAVGSDDDATSDESVD